MTTFVAPDGASLLGTLAQAMSDRTVEIIDLTHTLTPDFPVMVLPPEFGQCQPFRIEEVSRYDSRGPGWYWNNIHLSEHAGTHFDAPAHWISGRHLPNNTIDAIPVDDLIAPAVVLDFSRENSEDEDFILTRTHLDSWERVHGPIPPRCWVLFRTDWSRHLGTDKYLNLRDGGQHSPGPDYEAVRFLVEERAILGFGTETVGTDAGQAAHMVPPYPAHALLHGRGRYGLQCLKGLDRLPTKGTLLIAAPLKIRHGSGSPLRVMALVPSAAAA